MFGFAATAMVTAPEPVPEPLPETEIQESTGTVDQPQEPAEALTATPPVLPAPDIVADAGKMVNEQAGPPNCVTV